MDKHFYVFEGLDGSGKTTQAELFKQYVEQAYPDYNVLQFREPGGTPEGEIIRTKLKNGVKDKIEQLKLFSESRKYLLKFILETYDLDNTVIIMDRFTASTFAYQKYAQNIPDDIYNECTSVYMLYYNLIKDSMFTFYIDVPAEICYERITSRGEKLDCFEKLDFLKTVEKGYKTYFTNESNYEMIDGTGTIESIYNMCIQFL